MSHKIVAYTLFVMLTILIGLVAIGIIHLSHENRFWAGFVDGFVGFSLFIWMYGGVTMFLNKVIADQHQDI